MRTLLLREHQTCPAVELSPTQRDGIAQRAHVDVTPTPGLRDTFDLKPGSRVGVLELDGLRVVIQPKIRIDRALFLLTYSLAPKHWRDRAVDVDTAEEVVEAIAAAYARQLERATRRGLLRDYRRRQDSLPVLRGRWRTADQIRDRYGRMPPVEVRYDDYTTDVLENRLLRAALTRLRRCRIRSVATNRSLLRAESLLAEVTDVEFNPRQLPEVTYTRLNRHYRPAIELARLILRSLSIELAPGAASGWSFLVDMNTAFEDFVAVALREALGVGDRALRHPADSVPLDTASRVSMTPDIGWWRTGRCEFIGDVKYKVSEHGKSHDLYQLLAYVTGLDLRNGMLIYASTEGVTPTHHRVVHAGQSLHVHSIALEGSPDDILGSVAALADRVRGLAARRSLLRT